MSDDDSVPSGETTGVMSGAAEVCLADLVRPGVAPAVLEAHGLSPEAASRRREAFSRAARGLLGRGAAMETRVRGLFVPGRIEVLGKHTDYCGGASLLAATEQGFSVVVAAESIPRVEVVDARSGECLSFPIRRDLEAPRRHWSAYPMAAVRRIARDFAELPRGVRIAFHSDLPPASGMSSSSVLVTATMLALEAPGDLAALPRWREIASSRESLATYAAAVESGASCGDLGADGGVGTHGGSEDHTAILCSRPGALSLYRFRPLELMGRLRLDQGLVFAVASSGVRAEKIGAARERYNRASRLAAALVELWNAATGGDAPHLGAVVASSPHASEKLRDVVRSARHEDFPTKDLLDRAEHFAIEHAEVIPGATECLSRRDLAGFGRCVDRSWEAGAELLGNQTAETLFLTRAARRLGAVAASPFGAGFGGSVWALVQRAEAARFVEGWRQGYRRAYPRRTGAFFTSEAGPGAFGVDRLA